MCYRWNRCKVKQKYLFRLTFEFHFCSKIKRQDNNNDDDEAKTWSCFEKRKWKREKVDKNSYRITNLLLANGCDTQLLMSLIFKYKLLINRGSSSTLKLFVLGSNELKRYQPTCLLITNTQLKWFVCIIQNIHFGV